MDNTKRYYVWGRRSCEYCQSACALLYNKKKLYDFFDHEGDEAFVRQLMDFYEHQTVPLIVENNLETGYNKFIGGFTELENRLKEQADD